MLIALMNVIEGREQYVLKEKRILYADYDTSYYEYDSVSSFYNCVHIYRDSLTLWLAY